MSSSQLSIFAQNEREGEKRNRKLMWRYRHAGRETVDVKDVLLLVRRNEQLREVLEEAAKEIRK